MALLIPIRDLNPYKRFPLVTVGLIAANVVAFFAVSQGLAITDTAAYRYGAVPCDVLNQVCTNLDPRAIPLIESRPALLSILTSMFMHGDILHLAFNMLFLWVFGNNVEDRLGHAAYAVFYLATGVAASFAHIIFSPNSAVPTVGASGAISGILGAYILLWPAATIVSLVPLGIFFFSVRTPAWVSLGLWFVAQLLGGAAGFGRIGGGGVAYLAHIGGFVAGMALIIPFGGRRKKARLVRDGPWEG